MAAPVMEAVEALESHLHPTPSWAVADHPQPNGREEVWRFSPLRAMRGLLTDAGPTTAPLWGIPSGDKDLYRRAGVRTTMGSRLFEHQVPDVSDEIVETRSKRRNSQRSMPNARRRTYELPPIPRPNIASTS